ASHQDEEPPPRAPLVRGPAPAVGMEIYLSSSESSRDLTTDALTGAAQDWPVMVESKRIGEVAMTPTPKKFACGFARRHFLLSLVAPVLVRPRAGPTALQTRRKDSELPIHVMTLNHVSFDCVDLRSSVEWYGQVFGLAVLAFQDYRGGQTVVRIGDGPSYMALSQRNKDRIGQPPNRRPHFCWGVPDFSVDKILRALSEMEAPAQAVLREGKTINGVNFDDPD